MDTPHEDPGLPPAQLRVETDLGGTAIRVSGEQDDPWAFLQGGGAFIAGFAALGLLFVVVFCADLWYAQGVIWLGAAVLAVLFGQAGLERAPRHSRLLFRRDGLHIQAEDEVERVDWRSIRAAEVHGGARPELVLQRYRDEAVRIPMQLEPTPHAVWLAKRIEAERHAQLQRQGTAADIPKALRNLRRTE